MEKIRFLKAKKQEIIKSKADFFVYYFNNLMAIESDLYGTSDPERIKGILRLVEQYKRSFRLSEKYSTPRIWVKMKKYYSDNWDVLMWLNLEYEKGNLDFPFSGFIRK